MGLSSQRTAITQYFHTNWNTANGVVAYPNKQFTTPAGEPFLVFNIMTFFRKRASIGIDQWLTRRYGAVQVDIYVPEGDGVGGARTKADLVEALFESKELVTSDSQIVRFQTPYTVNVAINEQRAGNLEDAYHRLVVTCEFYVDEEKET